MAWVLCSLRPARHFVPVRRRATDLPIGGTKTQARADEFQRDDQ